MTEPHKTEADHLEIARLAVLEAALPHVVFDGWSAATLDAAVSDSGVDVGLAAQVFPRGAIDLAVAFHMHGDQQLTQAMLATDMTNMRYRDRVAYGVCKRLEIAAPNREAVRRATTLFALPTHNADGAKAIWHTADTIWNALGDTSLDVNWYTKRATLSAVYSAALLFWLGDESGGADTDAFIARRVNDVMQFEKLKASVRDTALAKAFMAGPGRILDGISAPKHRK